MLSYKAAALKLIEDEGVRVARVKLHKWGQTCDLLFGVSD